MKIPTGLSEKLDKQLGGGWQPGSLAVLVCDVGTNYSVLSAAVRTMAREHSGLGYQVGFFSTDPQTENFSAAADLFVYKRLESVFDDKNDILIIDDPQATAKISFRLMI